MTGPEPAAVPAPGQGLTTHLPLRQRRVLNLLNGSTGLGLLLARAAGIRTEPGPHGLLLACGYPARPPAPHAMAVTVGEVVLLRLDAAALAAHPRLLEHEARHASQWARCGGVLGFLPAYLVASVWSWLRVRDFARANVFEVRAGLADGGYDVP